MSSPPRLSEVYLNWRIAVILGLGFSSGLPLALTQDTMQAWLVREKIDIKQIGLFGLVTAPYALKFLWAPLMDRYAIPGMGNLGRRRGWILATQAGLMAALVAMAAVSPGKSVMGFAFAALAVAFISASHDVVVDAYRTDLLRRPELGPGVAAHVSGYRLAMIVSGGAAMVLAETLPFAQVYALMAALVLLGVAATLAAPEPPDAAAAPASLLEAVYDPFRAFFRRLGARGWLVLGFILLFKIPEVTLGWQTVPFLMQGLGHSSKAVGYVRGGLGLAVTILGTLAGGVVVARLGLIRSLWVVGALGALSNAGFLLLALAGNSPHVLARLTLPWAGAVELTAGVTLMAAVVGIEAFCGGLVTAGFLAFLMSQCDRRYSATQFALLSSVMGLTGTLFRAPTGYVVAWLGWPGFIAATVAAGLPGMALLPWLAGVAAAREEEVGRPGDGERAT